MRDRLCHLLTCGRVGQRSRLRFPPLDYCSRPSFPLPPRPSLHTLSALEPAQSPTASHSPHWPLLLFLAFLRLLASLGSLPHHPQHTALQSPLPGGHPPSGSSSPSPGPGRPGHTSCLHAPCTMLSAGPPDPWAS